jgi:hypothetical protein
MRPLLVVAAEALERGVATPAVPLIGRELRAEKREQLDISRVAEGAGDGAPIVFSLLMDALGGRCVSRLFVLLPMMVGHDM